MGDRRSLVIMEIVTHFHVTLFFGVLRFHPTRTPGLCEFLDEVTSCGYKIATPEVRVNQSFLHAVAIVGLYAFYLVGEFLHGTGRVKLGVDVDVVLAVYEGPDDVVGLAVMRVEDAVHRVWVLILEVLEMDLGEFLVDDTT